MEIINSQFSKKELRRVLLQKRQSMPLLEWREKSDRLTTNIQNSVIFNQANTILSFFSFRQEPDISSLYTNTNKRWGFPRCVDKSLVWHFWQPNDTINIGAYGIKEPHYEAPIIEIEEVDLILVPCVGCDVQGYRLGYGGGYYDRLLNSPGWDRKLTMGVVFDFAYLSQLPVDSWDKPLERVITEKSICKKTEYKIAHTFPSGISVKQGDAELFLCSKKESETDKLEYIKLEDKLKAAVKIGLISDEIKIAVLDTYELRSSVHIQTAVKKTIEFEIKHCRDAFYTLIDFLKQIRTFLNYSETPELKEEEERITSEFEENLAAVRQDNIDNQIGYIPGII